MFKILFTFPINQFPALFKAHHKAGNKQGGYIVRGLGRDDQERKHLCVVRSAVRVCFVSVSFNLFGLKWELCIVVVFVWMDSLKVFVMMVTLVSKIKYE